MKIDPNTEEQVHHFGKIDEKENPLHLMIRTIEADVHALGWDQRPRMFAVQHHPDDDQKLSDGIIQRTVVASELQMFREFYDDPELGLKQWISSAIQLPKKFINQIHNMLDQDFYGWLLITECWTLDSAQEDVSDKLAVAMDRSIDQHPARQEARMALLATKNNESIQLQRIRDDKGQLDSIEIYDSYEMNFVGNDVAILLYTLTAMTLEALNKGEM